MPKGDVPLPSLLRQALSTVASLEAPPPELVAHIVQRIRVAAKDEIALGLHALWPYTRHITRDDWLGPLSRLIDSIPSAPPIRADVLESMEKLQLTPEQVQEGRKALADLMELAPSVNEGLLRVDQRSSQAVEDAASLHRSRVSNALVEHPQQPPVASEPNRVETIDPLAAYLPQTLKYYDRDAFWYCDSDDAFFPDTREPACPLLTTVALELRRKQCDDSLFWGVVGRVYEPFAPGDPDAIEEHISSAKDATLAERVSSGEADLLDYWHYLEDYADLGDDDLESEHAGLLAAFDRASAAECEAFFSVLERLDFDVPGQSPRPEEERLPIADTIWETILAKPDVSVELLARGGLFYWRCRDPVQAPPRALAALGRVCEGHHRRFWEVLPFLPFWAAARGATAAGDCDLAATCWKRSLVDIAIFSQELEEATGDQVHAFPFDPRLVRDIYAHFNDPLEHQLLSLALKSAVQDLQKAPLDEWSQLHFVLSELCRRLGVKAIDEESLKAFLGAELCKQLDEETKRLLAEAEATWGLEEQELHTEPDLAQIGLNYRRAIENEWRLRLAPTLAAINDSINPRGSSLGNPKRSTLGSMLRVLQELNSHALREQLRQHLATVVWGDSLFNQIFLKRASSVVARYLNQSAHSRLDREQCRSLRSRLLDDGMLHDLLASVRPLRRGGR